MYTFIEKNKWDRSTIYYTFKETPFGDLLLLWCRQGLCGSYFAERKEYAFLCALSDFDLKQEQLVEKEREEEKQNLCLIGTPFQLEVWALLAKIPFGKTMSYKEMAQKLNRPKAYRAVARAIGRNPLSYFIPCHRVIASDGSISGYRFGREIKEKLLDFEKSQLE
jgi:O-6-methylguanine DNA methyltransferase